MSRSERLGLISVNWNPMEDGLNVPIGFQLIENTASESHQRLHLIIPDLSANLFNFLILAFLVPTY